MAVFLPHGSRVVFGSQINRTQLGAHLRTCLKKLTYLVIQAVPFLSPIVGGHQQPLKRVTFSPSPKRSRLESPGKWVFSACHAGTVPPLSHPKTNQPLEFSPRTNPPRTWKRYSRPRFLASKKTLPETNRQNPWVFRPFDFRKRNTSYSNHPCRTVQAVSFRKGSKKTNIHAMWFKLWPLYPRSLEVTWPSQKGHKDLPGTVFFFNPGFLNACHSERMKIGSIQKKWKPDTSREDLYVSPF